MRSHPASAAPPYPEHPPGWIDEQLMKGTNRAYYAKGLAGQVTDLLEQNSWVRVLLRLLVRGGIWFLICLFATTTWDAHTLAEIAHILGESVPPVLDAAADSRSGRLLVNAVVSAPIIGAVMTYRLIAARGTSARERAEQ